MKVDLFDFDLPDGRIAQRPADPRESARLLHIPPGGPFGDLTVADLPEFLTDRDMLVVNDTKVIPTRLFGRRDTVTIEATLIEETASDSWLAFARPGKRLRMGDTVSFDGDLTARVEGKLDDGRIALRFSIGGADLRDCLWRIGSMPLPPYIKRPAGGTSTDRDDYQTVFAAREGAVAAPTASLHFTEDLLRRISERGIGVTRLTLHVGAGTFLPVKADDTDDHIMHSEWAHLSETAAATLNAHKASNGRIVAVGTTALRTLESAVQRDGTLTSLEGQTDLFITPGYRFGAVDRLMTNFHLPKSTLFMLVCAFSGLERMQAAYAHAIAKEYRFFSYGDACLLDRGS